MSTEVKRSLPLEIAHVLFIDVVGYSKLLIDDQRELQQQLNDIVRGTEQFRVAETVGKLVRLPTGDGMALVFFTTPEAPVQCALQISEALHGHPQLRLRMGINTGPVSGVADVNDKSNVAGAGINMAQRVMDIGDAGHILLSKRAAEDLLQYRQWEPHLHDLGEFEVKHGVKISIVNLYTDKLGNRQHPEKLKQLSRKQTAARRRKRTLVAGLLLVAIALPVGALIFLRRTPSKLSTSQTALIPEKSIAVLPFENLSASQENAFFTDGVQDEILTDVAKVADLKVISRTSVMQYKDVAKRNLREIASALGVAHVLEGSVQRAVNRVRVNAQLIDTHTNTHMWAETYDRDLADVFAIQSDIAQRIAAQLQAKLSPNEKAAIEERPTKDLGAYDLYVRAKLLVMTPLIAEENYLEAARLLDQAIARDPDFFLAYCLIAEAHSRLYAIFDHTPVRRDLADRAVKAALHLRPEAGEAHLARARYLSSDLDYDNARTELALAQRTLPNNAQVFALMGHIDHFQGRWSESTRNYEEALELDPRNLFTLRQLAFTYLLMRRFTEGATALDRAIALAPEDGGSRVLRAWVDLDWRADPKPLHKTFEAMINEDPAVAAEWGEAWIYLALCERDPALAERALTTIPEGFNMDGLRIPLTFMEGCAARAFGDDAAARKAFTAARAEVERTVREQPDYGPPLCVLGLIDAGLGRKEEAIREGRRASELFPVAKDAINGAHVIQHLGVIYAWTVEKDLAIEQIAATLQVPGRLSYGQLRLHPFWDPLRGDPRFEKIVASLAPK
jgi:TolB-like protein/class 3 adenylate cyclase/Tfp pilus assembly protein PilF